MAQVITRFAPSPTGFLHIGGLRTAAYAYALAKHNGGKFILRIEDTDQKREVADARSKLEEILKRFGLIWDEYYVQSERVAKEIYLPVAKRLIEEGKAYYCQCEAKNAKVLGYTKELRDPCRDKQHKSGAIKLKIPDNEIVKYRDFVGRKEISWSTSTVSDPTLLKTDGFPTYHLAVVVDDHEMGVTHVLRGHDWMPSTPIHLLIYKYLGYDIPEIGHLTDILDPEGGKLSKRKGTVSVENFIARGYLPQALFNFVILLGWAPKDNQELFSLEEFVTAFDPAGLQISNPVLNVKKLNWFNGHYIRGLSNEQMMKLIKPFVNDKASDAQIELLVPLIRERIEVLEEIGNLTDFIWEDVNEWPRSGWKSLAFEHISQAKEVIGKITDWNVETLNTEFMALIERNNWKTGHFFMNLRIAISGQGITPPITECIVIMGKDEVITRLGNLLENNWLKDF